MRVINIGVTADDHAGDSIRDAFDKTNKNFSDLLAVMSGMSGTTVTVSFDEMIAIQTASPIMDTSYPTLALADAAAIAAGKQLTISKIWTTAPSTISANVKVLPGGGFNVTTAVAFNGQFEAFSGRVFFGSGAVSFALGIKVYTEWWGALGDGNSASAAGNNTAFTAAFAAAGINGSIGFMFGAYCVQSSIQPLKGQTLEGLVSTKFFIKPGVANAGLLMVDIGAGKDNVTLRGFEIDGTYVGQTSGNMYGVVFASVSGGLVENCNIHNFRYDPTNASKCVFINNSTKVSVRKCNLGESNNNLLVQGSTFCRIDDVLLDGNYGSEALSIYSSNMVTYPCTDNVATNVVIKNASTGINLEGCRNSSVIGFTINDAFRPLAIHSGGNTISAGSIIMGARSTGGGNAIVASSKGELTTNAALIPWSIFSDITVDVMGKPCRGIAVSNGGATPAINYKFKGINLMNSGGAQAAGYDGVLFESAHNVEIEANVSGFSGYGVFGSASTRSLNVKVKGLIEGNGKGGVILINNSVTRFLMEGTIKNNNQLGTANMGFSSGTGCYSITNRAEMYDDQATPTQTTQLVTNANNTDPYIGATPPTEGFWDTGRLVKRYDAATGASPGAVCVNSKRLTLTAQANAGATLIQVTATPVAASDYIGLLLDNGTYHWTTISVVNSGTSLTLSAAIPASRNSPVGVNVWSHRWKSEAVLS